MISQPTNYNEDHVNLHVKNHVTDWSALFETVIEQLRNGGIEPEDAFNTIIFLSVKSNEGYDNKIAYDGVNHTLHGVMNAFDNTHRKILPLLIISRYVYTAYY